MGGGLPISDLKDYDGDKDQAHSKHLLVPVAAPPVMFRKLRWKQTTQSCRRPRRRRDFSGPDEAQLPNQIGLRTRGSRASPETSSQLTSRAREMPDLSTHPRDVRDKPPSTAFTPVLGLTPSVPGVIMSAHGWLSKLWPLFGYPT